MFTIFAGARLRKERFLLEAAEFAGSSYDYFDYDYSHCGLSVSDYCGAPAEWKEWGHCCGFRWDGESDGVWSPGRGHCAFAGYDVVGRDLYGYFDHAFRRGLTA